jgi:hypothetical protein
MRSTSGVGSRIIICGIALALAISWRSANASTITGTLSCTASNFGLFAGFDTAGQTLPIPSTVTGLFTLTFDPTQQGITTLDGTSDNLQINSNSISSLPYPVLDYFNVPAQNTYLLSYQLETLLHRLATHKERSSLFRVAIFRMGSP